MFNYKRWPKHRTRWDDRLIMSIVVWLSSLLCWELSTSRCSSTEMCRRCSNIFLRFDWCILIDSMLGLCLKKSSKVSIYVEKGIYLTSSMYLVTSYTLSLMTIHDGDPSLPSDLATSAIVKSFSSSEAIFVIFFFTFNDHRFIRSTDFTYHSVIQVACDPNAEWIDFHKTIRIKYINSLSNMISVDFIFIFF